MDKKEVHEVQQLHMSIRKKQQPHLKFFNSLRCPEEALQRLQATELLPCILFAQIVPGNFAQPAVQYYIFKQTFKCDQK